MSTQSIEPSRLFNDEGLACSSYDGPVGDGAFKTHNRTPDQIQRLVITDRGAESYFKASVRMITCVHGHMETIDNIPSRPATLLVVEYRLHPKSGHSFNDVYTSFTFKEARTTPVGNSASPQVIAFAPFRRPRHWDKLESTVKKTQDLGLKLGVSGGAPVTAEVSGDSSVEETHLQQYFAKGAADIQNNDDTGLDDTIWWTLEQNRKQKLGVLPVFRVAVLIERQNMEDFVGIFKMDIHGSFNYLVGQVGGQVSRFFRRTSLDDPVNFSPTKMPLQGKTNGINPASLGSLVKDVGDGDGVYLPEDFHIESFLPS
ncbi:uncharacterized protein LY89DRAFT_722750 [Mollisia scopiformis]|uniref:Uncharacterized protein n=1 Tax=Mollisia scopiformis TaxID=149040 RepID=A0A194WUK0_MOLSC|nr:uncharacterized protein LY89DRAFT_722750 [Mollisia scopiformis]KUJ11641.1 hypothetical protein LY89DRAFT_722750 [Mollisia scopiformis]